MVTGLSICSQIKYSCVLNISCLRASDYVGIFLSSRARRSSSWGAGVCGALSCRLQFWRTVCGLPYKASFYLDEVVHYPLSILACDQAHVGATLEKSVGNEKVTFLAPLHQTPSRRIALLFAARACESKLNLLAG